MAAEHNPIALPLAAASLGMATYAAMDAAMKGLSIAMGAYNAMLWRTVIALAIAALLFIARRNRWPARSSIRLHVWRGVVTSLMALLFFWGLVRVPIAEAIALTFIAPLLAMYLAALLLSEPVGRREVLASLVGFAGALVIVWSQLRGEYTRELVLGMAAILVSALLYAYNLILQRRQALLAGPVEIVLFQNITCLCVYLLAAPLLALLPAATAWPPLLAAALLGLVSMMLVSWAYRRAEARLLIPVEYTAFAWAALFGWLLFNEQVTLATVAGTVLIVAACLAAMRTGRRPVEHVEATAL